MCLFRHNVLQTLHNTQPGGSDRGCRISAHHSPSSRCKDMQGVTRSERFISYNAGNKRNQETSSSIHYVSKEVSIHSTELFNRDIFILQTLHVPNHNETTSLRFLHPTKDVAICSPHWSLIRLLIPSIPFFFTTNWDTAGLII